MSAFPTVKPPESLAEAISPIGSLSNDEFNCLLEAVSGPRSFSLSKDQIEKLKKKVPALAAISAFTLATLSFLYSQISRVLEVEESATDVIEKLVDDLNKNAHWGDDLKLVIASRLAALFAKKETHQRFKKLQRLQSGFIPNAIGFSSFVDLRPDYNEGTPAEIKGLVAIIQFRVSTDADNPEARRFVVQMDEESLAELKKAVDHLYEKIRVLKADHDLSSHLIET
jgi:hypothetical protein